jgi:hypothetical protein
MKTSSLRISMTLAGIALVAGGASAQTTPPEEKLGLAPPRLETTEEGEMRVQSDGTPAVLPHQNTKRAIVGPERIFRYRPPERMGIRFGVYLPSSALARRQDGGIPFSAGLTYNLQAPRKRTVVGGDLYLDYAGVGQRTLYSTTFQDFTRGQAFLGMGISTRASLYLARGAGSLYAGAGGGFYRVETFRVRERFASRPDALTNEFPQETVSTSYRTDAMSFRGGYKLFTGLQLNRGFYAEAAYNHVGSFDGIPLNGVSLSLGLRR